MTEPINIDKDNSKTSGHDEPTTQTTPELEAAGGLASEISFDEVRRIYVQEDYHRFEDDFKRLDDSGQLVPSFSVVIFFMGTLWFLYRKMYMEAGIILGVGVVLNLLVVQLGLKDGISFVLLGFSAVLGMCGSGLYWMAINREIAKSMALFPNDAKGAIEWLRSRGGVSIEAPFIFIFALTVISIMLFPAQ